MTESDVTTAIESVCQKHSAMVIDLHVKRLDERTISVSLTVRLPNRVTRTAGCRFYEPCPIKTVRDWAQDCILDPTKVYA